MNEVVTKEVLALRQRVARLEEELAQAQRAAAHHHAVLARVSDFILTADRTGRVLSLNRSTGLVPPEQIVGTTLADYCQPSYRPLFQDALERVICTGEPAEIEVPGHDADGIPRWWHSRILPIGKRDQALLIATDITERKRAEEILRRQEQLLTRTQAMAHVGGWELRLPEHEIFWTEETQRIHEAPADYRPTFDEALRFYAPEAIPVVRAAVDRAVRTGQGYDLEVRFYTARGNERWVRTVGEAELAGRRVVKLFGTFQDITEQKRAALERARLVAILENTTDIVSWCTPDYKIRYFNRAGREVLGLADEASLADLEVRHVVPPDVWPILETEVFPRVRSDGIWQGELEGWGKDRQRRTYSQIVLGHRDERGQILFYSSIKRDVTDAKAAEEERRRFDRKLEQVQRLERLGVLAGGIAHDFNNLLTAILTNANLIAAELSGPSPARGHLEQIERASQRAADLCQQLLAYSGRGQFVVEPIDLNGCVRDMLELLKLSLTPRVTLQLALADKLPPVLADQDRVRQAVMNLVRNAEEAIGEQDGVITLQTGVMRPDRAWLSSCHLSLDLPEGKYVFLEVTDNGCGMTEEVQARLFDPFYSTKFTGRGLGMAAVLGIVRGHKGTIKIDSKPGAGAAVRVLLPPTQPRTVRGPLKPLAPVEGWRGHGLVMVVDDEEIVRKVVGKLLQSLGFEVILAADGNDALEKFHLQTEALRLVLLDLTMPHLDGEQTFRTFHLLRPDLPVLLMSGYSEQEATGRFAGEGLAGFLHKPFTRQQVIESLRRVLT